MAMLHFLYTCMAGNTSSKRMFLKVHILYIEESSSVYGSDPAVGIDIITKACAKYGLTFTVLPLEAVFDITNIDLEQKEVDKERMESKEFKNLHTDLPIN